MLFSPSSPWALLQLQPSTFPCSNLPSGDYSGLPVFSQDLHQIWDGKQPGSLYTPRGRSCLPPLLPSLDLHMWVATPCGPCSGSPSTFHSFWLCSSPCFSIFAIQSLSKSQDLLADILLALATLSISSSRRMEHERGDVVTVGFPSTPSWSSRARCLGQQPPAAC